jgi:hypothetical protein
VVVPVLAGEGRLGAVLAGDLELNLRELRGPLLVGLANLVGHRSNEPHAAASRQRGSGVAPSSHPRAPCPPASRPVHAMGGTNRPAHLRVGAHREHPRCAPLRVHRGTAYVQLGLPHRPRGQVGARLRRHLARQGRALSPPSRLVHAGDRRHARGPSHSQRAGRAHGAGVPRTRPDGARARPGRHARQGREVAQRLLAHRANGRRSRRVPEHACGSPKSE